MSPIGVFKATFANAIFAAAQFAIGPGQPVGDPFVPGRPIGFLAPPGSGDADFASDVARADAGEPYTDPAARAAIERQQRNRSAYYVDPSHAPPPLFVGSGFTDDLFPVDEALRFVNRARRDHPGTPISLLFGDFGHQRASNKAADRKRLLEAVHAWFDHYVRGGARTPANDVTASLQTCPRSAPGGATFTAPSFAALARGEIRYQSSDSHTVLSTGGDPRIGAAIDPATGGGDACAVTSAAAEPGTATYLLPAATGAGFTLLGAPSVTATLAVTGTPPASTQLAARLWDVKPGGAGQTLVARGLYRPSGGAADTFELHANGWHFAAGHVAKLELLARMLPTDDPRTARSRSTCGDSRSSCPCARRVPVLGPVAPAPCRPGGALRLRLETHCARAGLTATVTARGARLRRVGFYVDRRAVSVDRTPPFSRTVLRRRSRKGRVRVNARALGVDGRRGSASRVAAVCVRARRSGARFTG